MTVFWRYDNELWDWINAWNFLANGMTLKYSTTLCHMTSLIYQQQRLRRVEGQCGNDIIQILSWLILTWYILTTTIYLITIWDKYSKKVKLPATAMLAQKGTGSIAPTQSWPQQYMAVGGQRHAHAALYPGERTTGTHCTGGWLGLKAGLDTEATEKILCLCRGLKPGRPVCSQTLYWLSYPSSPTSWDT
jgi:hypothetical protein